MAFAAAQSVLAPLLWIFSVVSYILLGIFIIAGLLAARHAIQASIASDLITEATDKQLDSVERLFPGSFEALMIGDLVAHPALKDRILHILRYGPEETDTHGPEEAGPV
jgi:hypothetical protein